MPLGIRQLEALKDRIKREIGMFKMERLTIGYISDKRLYTKNY